MTNARAEIMALLNGQKLSDPPAFSGLIHITTEGLKHEGLLLQEAHHDEKKMARAAASTFQLTGMPSATLPLDLSVEAEALGAVLDFSHDDRFPLPAAPSVASVKDIVIPSEALTRGRLPVIQQAIANLKQDIGNEAVISGMIPGPYTLLLLLVQPGRLFMEMKKEPGAVNQVLEQLCHFLAEVAHAYKAAGADFITVHDMGGSPVFIGPAKYEQFVFPAEKQLIAELPTPRVLSVCGNINPVLHLLGETGADAISIDQTSDLIISRARLLDTLLFG
ncbi:MAG TPA: uroporphyrinogen decarboxylase family protein, partial [Anaerolineales bacterium]|nr:uroporphyrinogen decarboxylase family protein [Anaerolineales bacterium]